MGFIWKHSRRDQFVLLAVTLLLFPLLYLTLELPKRIINDAIGSGSDVIEVLGYTFTPQTFLILLCFAFLITVVIHGLMKMRINTMKGTLAERLLRRFRYVLISRLLLFPRRYYMTTSEGELVSMITSESEPLGGIMGDAVAQPVLQAGQMLTILAFLFVQNVWFGLAAVSLIPLQAWLIPRLQRRINLLNKARIQQVRELATEIVEVAAGSEALRRNAGWRHRMAVIGARLGGLFEIRRLIYRKKFFMKFLNNFITQLTPFFFFLIGGLLVLAGELTVGALVAALSAFKDLSSPWKELLTYYTQVQELSLRYDIIADRFSPAEMMAHDRLKDDHDGVLPPDAAIDLTDVSVSDDDGIPVLDNATLRIEPGEWAFLVADREEDRRTIARLLTGELAPKTGAVSVGGHDLSTTSQSFVAAHVGHVTSAPFVFRGTLGDNVMMPLRLVPDEPLEPEQQAEAVRSGNSTDRPDTAWLAPGQSDHDAARDFWLSLVNKMGAETTLLLRALDQSPGDAIDPAASSGLSALRPEIEKRIAEAGLTDRFVAFREDAYADGLTLTENLLFARRHPSRSEGDDELKALHALLKDLSLLDPVMQQALELVYVLLVAFDADATDHPLFRKLGLPPESYPRLRDAAVTARGSDRRKLSEADALLLLSVPGSIPADQFGRAFSDELKARIVDARRAARKAADGAWAEPFIRLDATLYNPGLTVLENAIFGLLPDGAGARAAPLRDCVAEVLIEKGDSGLVGALIYGLPTDLRGANLPTQLAEHISLCRAAIKHPPIMILNKVLSSYEDGVRSRALLALRDLLPDTTFVQIEADTETAEDYDVMLSLRQGKLTESDREPDTAQDGAGATDMARKLQAIQSADLFSGLSRKQQRLLAFGARWRIVPAGAYVFHTNDPPDGAYLIWDGAAALVQRTEDGKEGFTVWPDKGTLVGELGLIRNAPRSLDMRAETELELLHIGTEPFLAVVEADAQTAFKLLQVVSGYVGGPK